MRKAHIKYTGGEPAWEIYIPEELLDLFPFTGRSYSPTWEKAIVWLDSAWKQSSPQSK